MRPEVAVVMLHSGCAMRCAFCVTEPFPGLDFTEAIAVLEALRALGIRRVVLGGGEPFDWRHSVVALAGRAKELDFHVQVGTNGIHLPEGFERLGGIDRYVLPLESVDPGVHDRLRPYARSHHAIILDRLERLRDVGKSVTVSTVVTRETLDGLPALGSCLASYRSGGGRLHAWHLYRFLPIGRGGGFHAARLGVEEGEYHRVCDALKASRLGFRIFKRPDMYQSRSVLFLQGEKSMVDRGKSPARGGSSAGPVGEEDGTRIALENPA